LRLQTKAIIILFILSVSMLLIVGCGKQAEPIKIISRAEAIPSDAVKVTPDADVSPPKSYSDEYEDPVPMPFPINTAGAEDSPFMMYDGNTLYFFFTPDVRIPAEKQLIDGVTGIYVSKKVNGVWSEPERLMLQDKGKLALDGCEFVQDNVMLFCTAREGYSGIHWFSAEFKEGAWKKLEER